MTLTDKEETYRPDFVQIYHFNPADNQLVWFIRMVKDLKGGRVMEALRSFKNGMPDPDEGHPVD